MAHIHITWETDAEALQGIECLFHEGSKDFHQIYEHAAKHGYHEDAKIAALIAKLIESKRIESVYTGIGSRWRYYRLCASSPLLAKSPQ